MGVTESAVVYAFISLQLLHHHVQMVDGDSKEFFGGEECLAVDYKGQVLKNTQNFFKLPVHGCGQGNGAGHSSL